MLGPESRQRIGRALTGLRALYAGVLASLVLYWLVVQVIRKVIRLPAGRGTFSEVDWLRYPLYALGLVLVGLIVVLRSRLVTTDGLIRRAGDGQGLGGVLGALSLAHVILLALAEVPVVLGVALYFVGGYLSDFYLLALLSLLPLVVCWPRRAEWEALVDEVAVRRPDLAAG